MRFAIVLGVVAALGTKTANAAPSVTVTSEVFEDVVVWSVAVHADPALFENGSGSLALEIGFQSSSPIVGVDYDLSDSWMDIPGLNAFDGSVSEGLVVDTANGTIFVSAGSTVPLTAEAPSRSLLTITTMGDTTLEWGGPFYPGNRLAQAGQLFDTVNGSTTVNLGPLPEIEGDHDCNGIVDSSDLNLVLFSWNASANELPPQWCTPGVTFVGEGELNSVLFNWNERVEPPEPVLGDHNCDGTVNADDLNLVLFTWNMTAEETPDGWCSPMDGPVGADELNDVLFNWGGN